MQSNSFTSMFIYDQDQTDMMSSPAVCCESVSETRPSCERMGFKERASRLHLKAWCTENDLLTKFLCFQV